MKAQPKGAAPVSRDVVQEVKRKMGPPAGPPPAGMLSFSAPRNVQSKPTRDDDRRPKYDEYDNHYDDYDNHNDDSRTYDDDDNDDYYSDDDQHNGGRDFRYDGGHGRHGEQLDDRGYDRDDRDSRDYGRNSRDDREQERASSDNRSGENAFRNAQLQKARPVEKNSTDSLNASAQSKQSGGLSLTHSAEGKATPAEPVHKELTGPATQIVSTYLQRSRVNHLNYQPVLRATYRELKYYVTSPCPPGFTARCYIERNRSGSKMLAPYYSICADLDDGTGRELMVCRKVMRSRSPHYIFSLKSEDLWRKREQRSRLYLGKLRATSADDYVLYDNGICEAPEEDEELLLERERENGSGIGADRDTVLARKMARDRKGESGMPGVGSSEDVSLYRSELVAIHFGSKTRPAPPGKRGTEICLPHNFEVDSSGQTTMLGKPATPGVNSPALPEPKGSATIGVSKPNSMYNIVKPFEKIRNKERQNDLYAKSCFILHERTSRYDPLSSCLVDFKGRANMASVKNCQFVVSEPGHEAATHEAQMKMDAEKDFVLQLGKTTDDCFNMDYRYPLSLLQAFAICIARFDAKLTW